MASNREIRRHAETGAGTSPPRRRRSVFERRPNQVLQGTSDYLGVRFTGGPSLPAGKLGRFEFEAMYSGVDYSALEPGAAITVREGGNIVARGTVIERVPEANA